MKLNMTDQELMYWYDKGFEDELKGSSTIVPDHKLTRKAYELGALDALAGDDVSSVDLQTEQEILAKIRSGNSDDPKR